MNRIDSLWEKYKQTRDKSIFDEMVVTIGSDDYSASDLYSSHYFGDLTERLFDGWREYWAGNSNDLRDLQFRLDDLSSTWKAILGESLLKLLNVQEIIADKQPDKIISCLDSESNAVSNQVDLWINTFGMGHADKLRFLTQKTIPSLNSSTSNYFIEGTYIYDGCFARFSDESSSVIVVSIQSPIDGLFFPANGLVIKSPDLRYEVVSRIRKMIKSFVVDLSILLRVTRRSNDLQVVQLVRDKRPYHVMADELSGYYSLSNELDNKPELAFLERSSFVEPEVFNAAVISPSEIQSLGHNRLIYASHRRLSDDDWSESYKTWLISLAMKEHNDQLFVKQENTSIIWVGISGGEKRSWHEEEDSLVAFILWALEKFPRCKFVFDGWTANENPTTSELVQIEQHRVILDKILRRVNISPRDIKSVIGSRALLKIALASQSDFFIACAGTPAFWPSMICRVPGVVHNSTVMMHRVNNIMDTRSVVKVPDRLITDIKQDMKQDRWDFVNYSISPEAIIECCDIAMEQLVNRH